MQLSLKSKALLHAQSSWQPQIKKKGLREVHWSSPTQGRSTWARMLRVISRWVLTLSKDGDSTSLSSLPTVLDCPQFSFLFFLRTISYFPHSNLSSWPLTLSVCHHVTQVFFYRPSFHLFPSLFSCTELFHPKCQAAHLPLSKFMTFLSAHFSIISRSLQKAACLITRAVLWLA